MESDARPKTPIGQGAEEALLETTPMSDTGRGQSKTIHTVPSLLSESDEVASERLSPEPAAGIPERDATPAQIVAAEEAPTDDENLSFEHGASISEKETTPVVINEKVPDGTEAAALLSTEQKVEYPPTPPAEKKKNPFTIKPETTKTFRDFIVSLLQYKP